MVRQRPAAGKYRCEPHRHRQFHGEPAALSADPHKSSAERTHWPPPDYTGGIHTPYID
ncbi:hypothetical protein CBM2586_A11250 [Cupriavidus phytorum]|uniref:Uncharacterized protein n=1 Tax=Cupriavidus taiwanensis TaxID=164546 RepID=A0A975ZX19_9BURK|nr:hypothetical protein CBM2586_A11250 [Cupriavidus taiwanensis]